MAQGISLFGATLLLMTLFSILPAGKAAAQARLPRQEFNFSGYTWEIRQSEEPAGPLENCFAGRDEAVFLEPDGALRLTVAYREGVWYASEVYLRKKLGYGSYLFRLETDMAELDRNLVLGLFTYANQSAYEHREIDIEFSSWGDMKEAPKGQFVVQPSDRAGNMLLFPLDKLEMKFSCLFDWKPDRIEFAAWNGHGERPATGDPELVISWFYNDLKGIPKPGSEAVHLNLYLAKSSAGPYGDGTREVSIRSFEFKPMKK
jgi:hypothetical protein